MKRFLPLLALLMLASCKIEPQPIAFGTDACHFCHMTIVDRQHACELVTGKGKAFKFDAVECLLNHIKEGPADPKALLLVSDFYQPGMLIDAEGAAYLVSENLPSPMGAFLTAFASKAGGRKAQLEYGGTLYDWQGIQNQFNP